MHWYIFQHTLNSTNVYFHCPNVRNGQCYGACEVWSLSQPIRFNFFIVNLSSPRDRYQKNIWFLLSPNICCKFINLHCTMWQQIVANWNIIRFKTTCYIIEKQIKSRKDFWNLHPIKLLVNLPVAKWNSLLITRNNMYREIAALKLSFKFGESCKLIEQVQTWWK